MTCSASHTIVQADIDAGSYFNQACVDDGTGGATEACDDVTTPADQKPHLTITKDATESSYDEVGDVIHYTIKATNDGNTTLAAVTVTDPNASGLTCTPANGSSLAPGASMDCTASHTIVQADITAGHYFNEACVDDGAGGAAQACDDVTTPAVITHVGQITPTGTTCQQFSTGAAATLSSLSYSVKSGKLNQVAPGVFFYWVRLTNVPAGTQTFTITQAITTGNYDSHYFNTAAGSFAYTASCGKAASQTVTQSGATTTVTFNAGSGGTFIIGIKYDTGSIVGFTAPAPTTTVHYDFSMTGVPGSTNGIDVIKK
jgi:uncharacterized repeat protein (TIGR01451 family)